MTNPLGSLEHEFSLDPNHMSRGVIATLRAVLAATAFAAVILGVLLLAWPEKTLNVLAVFLGIYFMVSGALRLAVGIFSHTMKGGSRALNIILGVLLILVGVVAVRNVSAASVALVIFAVTFVGIGWIIEGVMALAESGRSGTSAWSLTFGVLSIVSGVVVLLLPASSAVVLLVFAGVALVFLGIVGLIRAFTFGRRSVHDNAQPPAVSV